MDIDRKFKIEAVSRASGKFYTHNEGIFFKVQDPAVPFMLAAYAEKCEELGSDEDNISSILHLKRRVELYQDIYGTKLPGVETKEEANRLLALIDN